MIVLVMQKNIIQAIITIENTIKDIHHYVKDNKYKEICRWFTKTNSINNHTIICARYEFETDDWFISSHQFLF